MKIIIDEKIKRADQTFYEIFKYLNLIRHVNPINTESEKQAFLTNQKRNPFFLYKKPRKDMIEIKQILDNLEIPEHELGQIFKKIKNEFLIKTKIIAAIGKDDSKVKELSSELYGWPNQGLINYSKKILNNFPPLNKKNSIPPEQIYSSLKKMLNEIGLSNWQINYSKKTLTRTKHNKKIFLCKNRLFTETDIYRIPVHEIGVHAIRYENGYSQQLKIFGYGFPDFLKTEEGLAVFLEEKTQNSNQEVFRNYAARIIAIECLKKNMDFRDCFNELKKYNFTDEQAWNLSLRAYRGGGFVKDHVYLEGYVMIKSFFQNNSDLKKLFIGKIGTSDIELIQELINKKIIKEPTYLPPFLK